MKFTQTYVPAVSLMLAAGLAACGQPDDTGEPDAQETVTVDTNAEPPGNAQSEVERNMNPDATVDELEQMRLGEWAFAQELYAELTATADVMPTDNFALSPYSLRSAFAMAWAGAVDESEAEMAEVLRFSLGQERTHNAMNRVDIQLDKRNDPGDEDNPPVILHVNNRFFVHFDITVLDSYLDTLALNYGADVKLVDFRDGEGARLNVNQWVLDQTEDRIDELLPKGSIKDLTPQGGTVSVLVNTVYFKAPWAEAFDEDATGPASFTGRDGQSSDVMMMHHDAMWARYAELDGLVAVELPLRLDDLAMTLVLPPADAPELDSWLSPEQMQAIFDAYGDYYVDLRVPKFKLEAEESLVLREPFMDLGMNAPFEGGFDNAYPDDPVFIDNIYHKVFFEIDEAGCEGAAATAIVSGLGFTPAEPPTADYSVVFDRPFLMILRERGTGTVLFMGRIMEPSAAG